MNKSKKTLKGPQLVKKVERKVNNKIWIIPSIILAVLLIIAILFDQLYERPLITINDDKYRLSDLTYYIYNVESYYDTFDQYYASLGGSYWDQQGDNGQTVRDMAMQDALSTAVYNEILYREATAAGYTLTNEESTQIESDIASLLYEGGLSPEKIKENGFTPEYLTDVLEKSALATRYKADVVDTLPVEDEVITQGFSKDEYRQYEFDYLFISTKTTDEAGAAVPMNEADKKAANDKLLAKYDAAKDSDDWSKLLAEDESEIKYYTTYILEDSEKETNYADFTNSFRAKVKTMDSNSVSDIFEDEEGYYLVKMKNNKATTVYDEAVKAAITQAENEAFDETYRNTILTKYEYKIHDRSLKRYRMGNLTID